VRDRVTTRQYDKGLRKAKPNRTCWRRGSSHEMAEENNDCQIFTESTRIWHQVILRYVTTSLLTRRWEIHLE
jgi:hypothetical protein